MHLATRLRSAWLQCRSSRRRPPRYFCRMKYAGLLTVYCLYGCNQQADRQTEPTSDLDPRSPDFSHAAFEAFSAMQVLIDMLHHTTNMCAYPPGTLGEFNAWEYGQEAWNCVTAVATYDQQYRILAAMRTCVTVLELQERLLEVRAVTCAVEPEVFNAVYDEINECEVTTGYRNFRGQVGRCIDRATADRASP